MNYLLQMFFFMGFEFKRWCLNESEFHKKLPKEISFFESYTFQSIDMYYIKVFRVRNFKKPLPVVVLNHSLDLSSDQFFDNPKGNLATELVKQGYDVWLINHRGNKYSCYHKLNLSNEKFYDFSFQEMGLYDFPVVIDQIYNITQQKLHLIGHSEGSAFFLTGMVEHPEYQDKIVKLITLAQASSMQNFKNNNPFLYDLMPIISTILKAMQMIGIHSLIPFSIYENKLLALILKLFCSKSFNLFCKIPIYLLAEKDPSVINWEDFQSAFYNYISPRTGIKNLSHYIQQLYRDDFYLRKYDYGKTINKEKYGSEEPPIYDFTKIKIPVLIYIGEGDQLSSIQDNLDLQEQIHQGYLRRFQKFGHFFWFIGEKPQIFINKVLEDLKANEYYDEYIKYN